MDIAVTGGSGHTGKEVIRHLVDHGYQVRNIDQEPPVDKSSSYMLCDLKDFGQTISCLSGCDAIIHLAAIPRPTYHPGNVVFYTNVLAAYNIFEAAALLGIRRVIYASSIAVTGYPFFERFFEPEYVPIDEDHPSAPQDAYGLSKHLGEEIAKAFVRRTGSSVISLRLPWIHTPETFQKEILPHQHDFEFGASNLWSYVDARDVAQAFRLSLEIALQGYHDYYVSAPDSFMETDSADLVKQFYPGAEIRASLRGNRSLLNSNKAEQDLGYIADYTWRDYLQGP